MFDFVGRFLVSKLFPWLVDALVPALKKAAMDIVEHYLKDAVAKLVAALFNKAKASADDYTNKAREEEKKAEEAEKSGDKETAAESRGKAKVYREAAEKAGEDMRKATEITEEIIRKTVVATATAIRRTDVQIEGKTSVTITTPPLPGEMGNLTISKPTTLQLPHG